MTPTCLLNVFSKTRHRHKLSVYSEPTCINLAQIRQCTAAASSQSWTKQNLSWDPRLRKFLCVGSMETARQPASLQFLQEEVLEHGMRETSWEKTQTTAVHSDFASLVFNTIRREVFHRDSLASTQVAAWYQTICPICCCFGLKREGDAGPELDGRDQTFWIVHTLVLTKEGTDKTH